MSKYKREITNEEGHKIVVDVYDVLIAFNVICPARAHAIKKLLCTGIRGKGDSMQDLTESVMAIERSLDIERNRLKNEG